MLILLDSDHVPLYLVINDFESGISNLVGDQVLVKLGEIAVRLKDVKQV